MGNEFEPQSEMDTVFQQIEHEVKQQYLSQQNGQCLSEEEILSLKLFTDLGMPCTGFSFSFIFQVMTRRNTPFFFMRL